MKKEGGGEAADERARAVSGGASDAERGGALGSGTRFWTGAGEASWAGHGEKLLGCRCENGPRGKVWAGLFGLEEEVGQPGWFLGFGLVFLF